MSFYEAKIVYIDTNRLCFDCISIDGNFFTEDVSYTNTGLKESGDIYHPELGDIAVIETNEDGGARLNRWYSARGIDANNLTRFIVGASKNLNSNSSLPGDRTISGPDGAFLSLLRGRLSKVGSSPMCQTIYSGLEGLIRTVCQNYDAMGSGFRIFSINSDGNVITRLCFSGSDINFSVGANENEDAMSENFEYQIDFTSDGMTVFIGDIDPASKKRNNNLVIYLLPNGDIKVVCGKNIVLELFSNGIVNMEIMDDNGNLVYNKYVGLSSGKVLLKEIIEGDVIRQINGNLYENITGMIERQADVVRQKANTIDNTSVVNRKAAGINISELDTNPQSGLLIR